MHVQFLFSSGCSKTSINKNIDSLEKKIQKISVLAAQFARATQLVRTISYEFDIAMNLMT
jgi:biotin operon repressor